MLVKAEEQILLESGTNELEIVEFAIGESRFGINVIKIREIIPAIPVTKVPFSHPHVEGVISLRNEVIPVINLAKVLHIDEPFKETDEKFIITEFNNLKAAFHVGSIAKIHRISWQNIEQPNDLAKNLENLITGIIQLDDEMILLPDFEKILFHINPNTGISEERIKALDERERSEKTILIAEDSPLLRELLQKTLEKVGYCNLEIYSDGEEAFNRLAALAENGDATKQIQLVITDIEMPRMDGHHLTKRIKADENLKDLPVIIFSSLITNELRHKGEKVGADAQVSKPEVNELVKIVDRHIL